MMSTLVCIKCGEVSVETSRSVVLPFVCTGCQPEVNPGELPESLYWPIAGDDHEEALQDETATTQATVELISDLENQLALSKEVTAGQTEIIEALEKLGALLSDRVAELTDLSNVKDGFLEELTAIAHALAFHYGYASGKVKRLEKENGLLKKTLDIASFLGGIDIRVIAD